MDAALVQGNEARGVAEFVEDSRGNLVDVIYHCVDCAMPSTEPLPWPAYSFPDYDVVCTCGRVINHAA